jgi:hypothetical protein
MPMGALDFPSEQRTASRNAAVVATVETSVGQITLADASTCFAFRE